MPAPDVPVGGAVTASEMMVTVETIEELRENPREANATLHVTC
jgi:hypothetical protein